MNCGTSARSRGLIFFGLLVLFLVVGGITGCVRSNNTTTVVTPAFTSISGNWELDATPSSGAAPFTALGGYFNEEGTDAVNPNFVSAALQAQSTTCYAGTGSTDVPVQGQATENTIVLVSFPVNGQVIAITATKNSTGTAMTGTYNILGGCANNETGTFTATLYSPVNGNFTGTIQGSSPAETINLALTQSSSGTGRGQFFISGSATFQGIGCFTSGTLQPTNSYVVGSSAYLIFNTNEMGGSQIAMTGTINSAATTLTVSNITVTGGGCAGPAGTATLTN